GHDSDGPRRSQGSILRSATDPMSLSAIRWDVGPPAPTKKISVWFKYSMIPDQIRNTQSWGSAVPGKHPTLRYGCYVITGSPLGGWNPSSDEKQKCSKRHELLN